MVNSDFVNLIEKLLDLRWCIPTLVVLDLAEARSLDSQEVVFRKPWCSATTKSGIYYGRNNGKTVMFHSKNALSGNNTISLLFRTQYNPYFFIAEYYFLRNIT
jgi:hypothetical protein